MPTPTNEELNVITNLGPVESEFNVVNSFNNKDLYDCITTLEPKFKIYSVK